MLGGIDPNPYDNEGQVDALVECGIKDYVFHGHSHEAGTEEYNGTVRVNPGGISIPPAPSAFSVATLETVSGELEFHDFE